MKEHLYLPLPRRLEDISLDPSSSAIFAGIAEEFIDSISYVPDRSLMAWLVSLIEDAIEAYKPHLQPSIQEGLNGQQIEYDQYFLVCRIGGDLASALFQAGLVAYYQILEDSLQGHSLSSAELFHLRSALQTLFISITTGKEG